LKGERWVFLLNSLLKKQLFVRLIKNVSACGGQMGVFQQPDKGQMKL
jgi:hypothetical protein